MLSDVVFVIFPLLATDLDEATLGMFVTPLALRYDLLEQWIEECEDPLETFAKMRPVLLYLVDKDVPSVKITSAAFCERMAEVLFSIKTYEKMVERSKLTVAWSDRFRYSNVLGFSEVIFLHYLFINVIPHNSVMYFSLWI